MKKFWAENPRFNGDYIFFSLTWALLGVMDLLTIEIPSLVMKPSGVAWLGVAGGLMFLTGGLLMMRGLRLGVALIVLAVITACVKQYITDGWPGFTCKVLTTILLMAGYLVMALCQKKDGRTAWSQLR